MNWLEQLKNPNLNIIKSCLKQLLKDRADNYDELAERMSASIVTKKDLDSFIALISDIYHTGYLKSLEQHKDQLQKLGIKVKLSSDIPKSSVKIFE